MGRVIPNAAITALVIIGLSVSDQLIEAQHHYKGKVLATTHVYLDSRNCPEVIILRGRGAEVQHFADHLLSLRGVKHGKLVMTAAGQADSHRQPP